MPLPRPTALRVSGFASCPCSSPLDPRAERFVDESHRVLVSSDTADLQPYFETGQLPPAFERAGPRRQLGFDPSAITCGIVTCGGLCPGLNNVIRSVVLTLTYAYGVHRILGFRYGYAGLASQSGYEPMELTPEIVEDIHEQGGTLLGTSRGAQDIGDMVDMLVQRNVDILFAIGGDGTLRGASALSQEIARRNRRISVIGIPKTIDNDLAWIERSFGFATATMMIAIITPMLHRLSPDERFRSALVLAVPFGANIGGIGTPIGTPPNAIAYGALHAAGYHITFLKWVLVATPLAVLLLAGVGLLLYAFFRPSPGLSVGALEPAGALSTRGKVTLMILGATVLLWLTSGQHGLSAGATALLAAGALTALQVLDRRDVDSIDWDVIILMWGGLSLGIAMQQSGLIGYVGQADLTTLQGGTWGVALVIALLGVSVSTFMSNTATAALLVPMALALSIPGKEQFAMLAALACSFAMAMPVSTPPNAMAYATGEIGVREMIRTGGLISIAAVVLMLLGYQIMVPLVF